MSLYQIVVQVELCSLSALFPSLRSTRISALYTRSIHSYTCSTTPTRVPVYKTVFPHTHCASNSSHNTLHITIRLVISSLSIPHVPRYVKLLSNTALSATGSGELWLLGWEREAVVHEAGTMGYRLWQIEEANSSGLQGYHSGGEHPDRSLGPISKPKKRQESSICSSMRSRSRCGQSWRLFISRSVQEHDSMPMTRSSPFTRQVSRRVCTSPHDQGGQGNAGYQRTASCCVHSGRDGQ